MLEVRYKRDKDVRIHCKQSSSHTNNVNMELPFLWQYDNYMYLKLIKPTNHILNNNNTQGCLQNKERRMSNCLSCS